MHFSFRLCWPWLRGSPPAGRPSPTPPWHHPEWHGHWGDRDWHDWHHWWGGPPVVGVYAAPPPVVYAPPPVTYVPPGITLGIHLP